MFFGLQEVIGPIAEQLNKSFQSLEMRLADILAEQKRTNELLEKLIPKPKPTEGTTRVIRTPRQKENS